jgi:hypothetical protein
MDPYAITLQRPDRLLRSNGSRRTLNHLLKTLQTNFRFSHLSLHSMADYGNSRRGQE